MTYAVIAFNSVTGKFHKVSSQSYSIEDARKLKDMFDFDDQAKVVNESEVAEAIELNNKNL